MGYILPLENYQYSQYHSRIIKNKQPNQAKSVEKPFKAVLEKKHQDLKGKYDRIYQKPTSPYQTYRSDVELETLHFKGKYVNETI
ncbi:hypothetical protein D8M04_09425 [Oceanobacillus piezotolerans]|uniref:Uncharacterized protein n=1 Tax=Oceanobacillus piezotolerans TaxID=2448030 RepID=A0A498D5Y8_9BACI|nr:hypothetical protein [Oceanobacillus piezotolerans]RLL45079.1 hypothetical protein D8M04_09425 [Oceanobacillus piezotolerans]